MAWHGSQGRAWWMPSTRRPAPTRNPRSDNGGRPAAERRVTRAPCSRFWAGAYGLVGGAVSVCSSSTGRDAVSRPAGLTASTSTPGLVLLRRARSRDPSR